MAVGGTGRGRTARGYRTPAVRPVDAGGPRATPGPGAVGPDALGGGHGRCPRPAAVRPPSRGRHPDGGPAAPPRWSRPCPGRSQPSSRPEVPAGASPDGRERPPRRGRPVGRPADPAARPGAGPSGQRRPGPVGRPRAGHLDDGRARGRLHPGRPLRRRAGRPGHPGRPPPRRGQPAGLLAPGARPVVTASNGPSTTPCGGRACCPASGTRSTSTATPAAPCCWPCSRSWPQPRHVDLVRSLVELAAEHDLPAPNVDLALAAVAWSTGMPPDAGRTLFTMARVAGWTAHYLEELGERPLRYRARAVYATPGRPAGRAARRSAVGSAVPSPLRFGHDPSRPPSRPHLPGDRSVLRHRRRDRPPAGRPGPRGHRRGP